MAEQLHHVLDHVAFTLVLVPPRTFTMGSPEDELGRHDNEVQREVTLTRPFAVATTPVTQGLWREVMGGNPSFFTKGDEAPERPVETVSWFDAVRFCNALSLRLGLAPAYVLGAPNEPSVRWERASEGFRLPTEAEWECAARAGASHVYAGGDDLDAVAWHPGNSRLASHPVARKSPNGWGLHDMSGNVREWCWDRYGRYDGRRVKDPSGPRDGGDRVLRGGSWYSEPRTARVASRSFVGPALLDVDVGLRVVRTLADGLVA